ncbi:MAG: hypothetical protein NUV77_18640 [Thermoguttaceae bacterium]|jgi:hypothetical protein|nr:hypothetical protein [Thermoguttaceae bacterium]
MARACFRTRPNLAQVLALVVAVWAGPGAAAAELLEGEFGDIDLGRPLVEPTRFPTIQQLREAVRTPEIRPVVLFRLYGSDKNHYLPVWSGDGRRLAFQRSEIDVRSSKLLLFASMAQPEPSLLSDEEDAYDYMFRWVVNSPASYTFVRIRPGVAGTRVYLSEEGGKPGPKLAQGARYAHAAAYRRTDGIWRIVYQQNDQVVQEAWTDRGPLEGPLPVTAGAAPRWSRDGARLLLARMGPGGEQDAYEMVVWRLRTGEATPLPAGVRGLVRSPTWSPDERHAAYYVRELGEGKPWRIRVCPTDGDRPGRTLGNDVRVNAIFESEGPSWEPSGRRIWFFSNEYQEQAYCPLVAADIRTGELAVVHYPRRVTNPLDLAVHPASEVPELAFVGQIELPQDLFILFLNHY